MQLFSNNASTVLTTAVNTTFTTLSVTDASLFPSPTGGDFFNLALIGLNVNGQEASWEILRCTARTGNSLTVTRAQEGTVGVAWGVGTRVEVRMTAGFASTTASHLVDVANPHATTKAQVGLGNVDNTADTAKPVSTLQAAADATKLNLTGGTLTGALYARGAFGMKGNVAGNPTMYDVQDQAGALVLELGRSDNVAATTALDFHTGAVSTDYDTRLEFTGGTGVSGNGAFNVAAANFSWNGDALATAASVNLKAPLVSPVFTGTPRMTGLYVGPDSEVYLYEENPNSLSVRTGATGSEKYFKFHSSGNLQVLGGTLAVSSTTKVANLNADLLDGLDSTAFAPIAHVGAGGVAHADVVAAGASGFMTGADKTKLNAITGTNTGDQTSIVGITGTLAQFNTAVTDGDLAPTASPQFTGQVKSNNSRADSTWTTANFQAYVPAESTVDFASIALHVQDNSNAPQLGYNGTTQKAGFFDSGGVPLFTWPAIGSVANGLIKLVDGHVTAAVANTDYQTVLVSGTNIKTVNSVSLLGSGNIAVGDVTLAGVQTLTNKTITDIVFTLTGTTPSFTATNGAVQTWTLTAASTPTNALTSGQSIILVITPGAFTITWPSVVWTKQGGSGAAPTLFSAGKTSVVLWRVGAVLYGSHLGDTV